jgi:alpha-tubulin suppressor-like RCC1 family protein
MMPANSQASTRSIWLRGGAALLGLIALALLAVLAVAPASHAQSPGYTQVSAGYRNSCALKASGIDCWGSNLSGESKDQTGFFLQVTADTEHSCAIRSGLQTPTNVFCWGYDDNGQLSPPGIQFRQISAGQDYTCGVTANGYDDIVCWGNNYYGQSKYQPGPYKQVSASTYHACGLKQDGSIHCWGADYFGERADRTGQYKDVSAGEYHTCAITGDDTVECWGAGTKDTGFWPNYGQAMPPADKFLQVSAGALFTCGVKANHTLACWGYNFYGQVKRAPEGEFKQVSAGLGGHACAISIDDAVYCWGKNDAGQTHVPNVGGPTEPPTEPSAYNFQGFFAPVQADPTLNVVKAGSSVPLKFSLGGDQGLKVLAPDSPASGTLDCKTMEPADDLQPAASAGKSGLTYDPKSDTYTYVWKTEKAWTGCRYLSLQLVDGTEARAAFQLK